MSVTWFYVAITGISFILVLIIQTVITYIVDTLYMRQAERRSTALERVQEYRRIADFSVLRGRPKKSQRLEARAISNRRLVKTFDISNSFTTMDRAVHDRFLNEARGVIRTMDAPKWVDFFTVAQTALDRTLDHFDVREGSPPVSLATIARPFVFVTMLNPLFGVEPDDVNFAYAVEAAEAINTLWVLSKEKNHALSDDQNRLRTALQHLLPSRFPCSTEENPINLIIPAYETMWRIILHTYISAGFRSVDQETAGQFQQIVKNVPECFVSETQNDVVEMAVNFAKEGLRLYPPTRRIYRTIPTESGQTVEMKADVEESHRYVEVWGPDALQFRPSRFREPTPPAYMPFGVGLHSCPSQSGFAFRAIMIQVVVLAHRLGSRESGSKIRFGNTVLDENLEGLLPTGRLDMEGWTLQVGGSR